MRKRIVCIVLSLFMLLCVFAGCADDEGAKINTNIAALEGTWEYSEGDLSIVYVFSADGTGECRILGYNLPYTFTADESNLTIVTDYITFYEGRNGMSFDELVASGLVREDLRYITERYTYSISGDTLRITDIAYSQISGSDIATLTLTKAD